MQKYRRGPIQHAHQTALQIRRKRLQYESIEWLIGHVFSNAVDWYSTRAKQIFCWLFMFSMKLCISLLYTDSASACQV